MSELQNFVEKLDSLIQEELLTEALILLKQFKKEHSEQYHYNFGAAHESVQPNKDKCGCGNSIGYLIDTIISEPDDDKTTKEKFEKWKSEFKNETESFLSNFKKLIEEDLS